MGGILGIPRYPQDRCRYPEDTVSQDTGGYPEDTWYPSPRRCRRCWGGPPCALWRTTRLSTRTATAARPQTRSTAAATGAATARSCYRGGCTPAGSNVPTQAPHLATPRPHEADTLFGSGWRPALWRRGRATPRPVSERPRHGHWPRPQSPILSCGYPGTLSAARRVSRAIEARGPACPKVSSRSGTPRQTGH